MLKLSTNEVGNYPAGWHEVTIAKATDGDFDGTRYIDLHFKDLPENLKCRVWSAVNATTGEDFGIGNLFHFANAGIKTDDDGILTIDDNTNGLRDRTLNVYLYPDPKNSKYSRVLKQPAPTVFKNDVEEFTETDVKYWMDRAEGYYERYVKNGAPGTNGTTGTTITLNKETATETADIPF